MTAKLALLAPMAILLALMTSQTAVAGTVTIDFEGGTSWSPIGAYYEASANVTFSQAVFFDLGSNAPGMSGTSFILHETLYGAPTEADPIVGIFSTSVSSVSIIALDVGGAGARMDAFDVGGNLIGFDEAYGTDWGVDQFFTVDVPGTGIRRIELYQPGNTPPDDTLAWDDLTFTTISGNDVNPNDPVIVPLPSAAWAGLGLLAIFGAARRRRKR